MTRMWFSVRKQCSRFWNSSSDGVQLVKDPGAILKVPLFDYFVLLAAAGWYRLMPSGGSILGKKRLAISESYGTITTPWGGMKVLPWEKENSLIHVFDPCWNRGRRLPAEEENLLVSADSSKTGLEKPLENRVSATSGKVNPKWF